MFSVTNYFYNPDWTPKVNSYVSERDLNSAFLETFSEAVKFFIDACGRFKQFDMNLDHLYVIEFEFIESNEIIKTVKILNIYKKEDLKKYLMLA